MKPQDNERVTIPPDGRSHAEQPRWRQDFPIEWPQDDYISRRDFTKFMVLVSLAFTTGQFWILFQYFFWEQRGKLPTHAIAGMTEIPVGGSLVFHYPDEHTPCILVRLNDTAFVAYDQLCTHLLCPVIPQFEAGRLYCPCHNGSFHLATGQPIAGPPRRALLRVKLEIRDDKIYATGVEEASG